jgi:hypothetical protein
MLNCRNRLKTSGFNVKARAAAPATESIHKLLIAYIQQPTPNEGDWARDKTHGHL